MKPYLSAALALVALVGCSSAKKPDGLDSAQRQSPLAPAEAMLTHSNVSQFDGQVAIQVKMELVGGNTVVTIPRITSWPVQNTFLGLDHFYYGAIALNHPVIGVRDEGCDELVVGGEACGWSVNYDGCTASGFGCFASRKSNGSASQGATTQELAFVLQGDVNFAANDHGAQFAVHARFSDDCSGWFSDGTSESVEPQAACKPALSPPSCSLSVAPAALEIQLGGAASTTVTVDETALDPLFLIALSIDPASLPSGVSVDFVPNPVAPPGTSMLTVQTTASAPLGVSELIVVGQGNQGEFQCRTTLLLNIREAPQPPVRTCSLSVDPSQLQVIRGSWAGATVTVGETGDEPLVPITLSIDPLSLPSGVSATLAPNPVNPPGTSIMTVQTMATAPLGVFQIPVLGEGHEATGELFQCRTTLELNIGEPPLQHGACYCPDP